MHDAVGMQATTDPAGASRLRGRLLEVDATEVTNQQFASLCPAPGQGASMVAANTARRRFFPGAPLGEPLCLGFRFAFPPRCHAVPLFRPRISWWVGGQRSELASSARSEQFHRRERSRPCEVLACRLRRRGWPMRGGLENVCRPKRNGEFAALCWRQGWAGLPLGLCIFKKARPAGWPTPIRATFPDHDTSEERVHWQRVRSPSFRRQSATASMTWPETSGSG